MHSLTEIIQKLAVNPEFGLPPEGVEASRTQFGRNTLTPLPREPLWKKFIEKFDEPIIKILLAAALLSMIVDLFQRVGEVIGGVCLAVVVSLVGAAYALKRGEWAPIVMFACAIAFFILGASTGHFLVEGLAVMIAIVLATGVAFLSEYKSDREFEVLNTTKESIQVKVQRAGEVHRIGVEDVVVGDIVLLETGDEIPADGRLFFSRGLLVDQSLMTGEAEPVSKSPTTPDDSVNGPDHPACLYRGTQVVDGAASLLVTEVGDRTYLGLIARRLSAENDDESDGTEEARIKRKLTISKEQTPLQQKLADLAGVISKVGYAAAILIFVAQLVRGYYAGEVYWPADDAHFSQKLLEVFRELIGYFVTMVIIIVVAVPEGLPMSVTVSLALAMRKMTRANSLVRQLVACETIGSATVICSDKTGTLTQNKMRVDRIAWDEQVVERSAFPAPDPNAGARPIDWIARISALNSTANLELKEGKTITIGNSTEGALLHWLRDAGIEYGSLRSNQPIEYQLPFSSERKRMTTVIRRSGETLALVKGAPEVLAECCQRYLDGDGIERPLDDARRQVIRARLVEAARMAMRTLAFAYARGSSEAPPEDLAVSTDLVYVGFVAIRDPLRDDVHAAIASCRRAGIDVKMITGDNAETARAIGYEIGLIPQPEEPIDVPGAAVLTSVRLGQLSDEELKQHLPGLRIVARAKPLDKYRLVKLLQELGEVVAVTGDGTNDAPALKKADVGLAMGIAGTEVSKEASKIVLLDDAFSTIVKAVHWGRSLYENIQRFVQFQLTINVSALVITFLGVWPFDVKAPFTVLQLLWINVIMDTFASIALCSEAPRAGVMNLPPKRRNESIVTPAMIRTILLTAGFFVVVMLGLLLAMKGGFLRGDGPWSVEIAGTRLAVPQNDPHLARDAEGRWSYQGQDAEVTFTVYQMSLFFSIYVFFQVWNQFNARSLTPEKSAFHRVLQNPLFLAIAAVIAIGQIVIVTFGGSVFKVEPLGPLDWAGVIAFTASVLVFAEIVRRIRRMTFEPSTA